jgi:hypothetical protein
MNRNDHDAPLIQLLSIRENPLVVQMTQDQLTELVMKLRQQPPKPQAKIEKADRAARYKAILDSL